MDAKCFCVLRVSFELMWCCIIVAQFMFLIDFVRVLSCSLPEREELLFSCGFDIALRAVHASNTEGPSVNVLFIMKKML